MIRKFQKEDLEKVMTLWLETNIAAHPFVPSSYWKTHFTAVAQLLPESELYVYENADREILGFVGLTGDYIGGLFVRGDAQSRGIGRRLLNHVKRQKDRLTLHVYRKNERAVRFYRREGFRVEQRGVDQSTGEAEYRMVWSAPSDSSPPVQKTA